MNLPPLVQIVSALLTPLIDGKHAELAWFIEQFDPAEAKFKIYLDVRK